MKYLVCITTLLFSAMLYADDYISLLYDENTVKEVAKNRSNDFITHINILSLSSSQNVKHLAEIQCLSLLIGKGNVYYFLDKYGDKMQEYAKIHITKHNKKYVTSVKSYLKHLSTSLYHKDKEFKLTRCDFIFVDSIGKVKENKIECFTHTIKYEKDYTKDNFICHHNYSQKSLILIDEDSILEVPTGKYISNIYIKDIYLTEVENENLYYNNHVIDTALFSCSKFW